MYRERIGDYLVIEEMERIEKEKKKKKKKGKEREWEKNKVNFNTLISLPYLTLNTYYK